LNLTVKLFAAARELAGAESVMIELPVGATVADLRAQLAHRAPALAGLLAKSAIAVNHDFTVNERVLQSTDEIAVIPPVSGG
jgi:molybdopterin converting factor subunit 1